ncbi:MAG: RNA 2',3'-cyclic phosphodiesterase [Gemmatimonadetes bacterium]|nr:RNA 2',3'-cyclic phosphodiesterase [Gemmatimonadota bacterium]MDA1104066.1 RNA 2',3'-cyclic phosphodiesterase [Gemmatimonadota bacterium]
MRLFIGISLPKTLRTRIQRAARVMRDAELPVRWIDPDHFHIALKTLGDVRREKVEAVEQAIGRVAAETTAFSTGLSGFGAFPTIRRPSVIWLGVGANAELRCLKQDLEWALGDIGFGAETRAFHPHVTLGRADEAGGAGAFRGLDTIMAELDFEDELKVHTLDLMRSHVSRDGAHYTVLSTAKLAST